MDNVGFLQFLFSFILAFQNNKVSKQFHNHYIFFCLVDLFIVDRKIISPNKNSLRASQLMSNKAVDNFSKG